MIDRGTKTAFATQSLIEYGDKHYNCRALYIENPAKIVKLKRPKTKYFFDNGVAGFIAYR